MIGGMSIIIVLYVIGAVVALASALIVYVLYSWGLARICKKLDACPPILAWIPLVQSIVIARTGDAADMRCATKKRNLTKQAIVSFILMLVAYLALLVCVVAGMLFAMLKWPVFLMYVLVAAVALCCLALLAFAVWFDVVWYIGFFRTARAFVPNWASWLLLVASLLWPQFHCVILLVLSFFKVKECNVFPTDAYSEQTE